MSLIRRNRLCRSGRTIGRLEEYGARTGAWLEEHGPAILFTLGAILLAIGGGILTISPGWGIISFAVGAISTVGGHVADNRRRNELRTLRDENASLKDDVNDLQETLAEQTDDYHDLVQHTLKGAVESVMDVGHTERASLFRVHDSGMVLVGRWSENHTYKNAEGEGVYPKGKGCIGKALEVGSAREDSLPSPDQDVEAYKNQQEDEWGISPEEIEDMTMRSRTYSAHRLRNHRAEEYAVLVLESTEAGGFSEEEVEQIVDEHGEHLVDMLERLEHIEPDPALAAQEGF